VSDFTIVLFLFLRLCSTDKEVGDVLFEFFCASLIES
jgi:hypothetical protein